MGRLPGVRRRRLLTRAYDISAFGPDEAGDLSAAGFEVVLLDAALGTRALSAVLAPLAGRHETSRPAVLLVMREGARPRLRPAYQAVIDDVVAAGLGERQLLARVHSAVRVRGWMSELSRKNVELQGLYGRLEVLASRMAEELRLASNVQRSLLPAPLQHARLDIAREFMPFREIGGDLYDFVPLGPHRMAFAIGDVMGKGVPAALLAANLKASIRAQVEAENVCPAALVTKVNRMFWDVVPNGLFASLFFGVFDLEASVLAFVNAGHHYPFLVTAQGGEVRDLIDGGHGARSRGGLVVRAGLRSRSAPTTCSSSIAMGSPTAPTRRGSCSAWSASRTRPRGHARTLRPASPCTPCSARSRAGRPARRPKTT